jgi:hypothetical protein
MAEIRAALAQGRSQGFGSDSLTDRALRAMKRAGEIRYVKVKDGGRGWELVPTDAAPAVAESTERLLTEEGLEAC